MTKGFGFPPDLDHWQPGDVIVRREVLRGQVWSGMCMYVIQHTDDLLVLYLPENTPIGFGNGTFPTPDGGHPWNTGGDVRWQGHGILQLHRPDDAYSVWVFWAGADRAFRCWVRQRVKFVIKQCRCLSASAGSGPGGSDTKRKVVFQRSGQDVGLDRTGALHP